MHFGIFTTTTILTILLYFGPLQIQNESTNNLNCKWDNRSSIPCLEISGNLSNSSKFSKAGINKILISKKQIDEIGAIDLIDVLKTVPDINITQSGNNPDEEELWNTSSGNQGLYFIAGVPANLVSENNDWMISPEFSLSGISSPVLTFKAKTLKDDWGLERFKIAVGNNTDYNDFITISDGDYIEVSTEWSTFEFDLSEYVGQNIRIGINYLSSDTFVLQTDEFKVEGTLSNAQNEIQNFEYYYNPSNDLLRLSSDEIIKNIQIYNVLGQNIIEKNINNYNHVLNLSNLSTSIYFVKAEGENGVNIFKLRVR